MAQVQPKAVWHLLRGQEKQGCISDQELLLLAELGHLKPNDLLWRPGFDGWRAANSVPGILTPPRLPGSVPSLRALPSQLGTKTDPSLSVAAEKIARWLTQSLLISKDYARSIGVHLRHAYRQLSPPRFDFGTLLSRIQPRGVVAGLLILLIFVGSLILVIRGTAIGTQPNVTFQEKLQTLTAPNAAKPFQTAVSAESKIEIHYTASEAFNVDNIRPTQRFISEPSPVAQSEPVPLPTRKSVVQSEPVPLPTRKSVAQSKPVALPARKPETIYQVPNGKGAKVNAATSKRMAQQKRAQPKPIRFGSFGYAYVDPAH
jgi:GYF domain 2